MSSATSLRVAKGGRKFAPKAKPRPARQPPGPETRRRGSRAAEHTRDGSPNDAADDDGDGDDNVDSVDNGTEDESPAATPASLAEPTGAVVIGLPLGIAERESVQRQADAATQQPQQPPAVRPSGTPIVVEASPRGASKRRPSVAPMRLATLTSPARPDGVRPVSQPTQLAYAAKRARASSSTPEPAPAPRMKTADDYELLSPDDINSLTIEYFCRDNRHGRPTKEFIERENSALRRLNMPPGSRSRSRPSSKPASPVVEKTPETPASAQGEDAGARMAAQVRVVNGKVVIDTDSLVVSRSDMAKDGAEPLELVDESERPRFINSLTYAKKRGSRKRWKPEETELFYQQLRKFGSDFEMISSVMPDRCRYDIRNKFKLEERKNPQRITDTLLRRRPQDVGAPPAPPADDAPPSQLEEYSMAAAGSSAADAQDTPATSAPPNPAP